MGWFTRKVTDPIEAFQRLMSPDKKTSQGAMEEFQVSLNNNLVMFLRERFEEQKGLDIRLKILEIFTNCRSNLSADDFREILKLLVYPENVLREGIKEILQAVDEERLSPLAEVLCTSTDVGIRAVIQSGIEHSGIIEKMLQKWGEYSAKEKILFLENIVKIQNPRTYPIFFDILKEEVVEAKKEEKRLIQMEFGRHMEKIKDPAFMEECVKQLPAIDQTMWYPVFKTLQFHGDNFFKRGFENLSKKTENYRLKFMQMIEQLSDPLSYPYLFPYLLDRHKTIPPVVQNTIVAITKRFSEELDGMGKDGRAAPGWSNGSSFSPSRWKAVFPIPT